MRDLLFKNLTSSDRKRKIISFSETIEQKGLHTQVHRHFICMVKELKAGQVEKVPAQIHILKRRDTRLQKERFICRVKGGLYATCDERLFLFIFIHSLRIELSLTKEKSDLGLDK